MLDIKVILLEKKLSMNDNSENPTLKEIGKLFRELQEVSIEDSDKRNFKLNQLLKLMFSLLRRFYPKVDCDVAANQALSELSNSLQQNRFVFTEDKSDEFIGKHLYYWFTRRYKWRIKDLYRQLDDKPLSLDNFIDPNSEDTWLDQLPDQLNLNNIDSLIDQETMNEKKENFDKIINDISQNQQLRNCHPRTRPDCNCYELFRRRYKNPPINWSNIARELNIAQGTVTAHWKRRCKPILTSLGVNI